MRTAAGVLLIVMFLVNGAAALGYTLMGGVVGVFGIAADEVGKNADKKADEHAAAAASASTMEDEEHHKSAADMDKDFAKGADKVGKDAKKAGSGIFAFGAGLGAVAIAQLVIAISVLSPKMPKTSMIVIGAIGICAEVACIFMSKFGALNVLGFAAGAFVIVAGVTLKPKVNPYALQPAMAGGPPPYAPQPQPPYGAQPPPYGTQPPPYGAPPGYGPPPNG